jgi:hypothetical protein
VTLRRIPLNGDGEVTLLYYQKVLPRPVLFLEVALDDDYLVLFFARPMEQNLANPIFSMAATFEIDIRSAVSYDVVKKISIPTSSPFQLYQFHYLNRFIVMGRMQDNFFRFYFRFFFLDRSLSHFTVYSIWPAALGRCVKIIFHGGKGLYAIR